jgi:hypothetical protein
MNGSFVIPSLRPRESIPDAHLRNGDDDEMTRGEAKGLSPVLHLA